MPPITQTLGCHTSDEEKAMGLVMLVPYIAKNRMTVSVPLRLQACRFGFLIRQL